MRKIAAVLFVVLSAYAAPAHAWWEYAKWGLTEKQLIAASKGAAKPCVEGPRVCATLNYYGEAKPPEVPKLYVEGLVLASEPAAVSFVFDDAGKLRMTIVALEPSHIRRVTAALNGAYGAPVDVRDGAWPSWTWRDTAKGTTISALDLDGRVRVTYKPIAKGL